MTSNKACVIDIGTKKVYVWKSNQINKVMKLTNINK